MNPTRPAASIDPREVDFYTQLADTWWNESGPFWPLHRLNALRTGYIEQYLCRAFERDPRSPSPLAGLSILDVGCGGGILSEAIAGMGAGVHGIDVVARNISVAQRHSSTHGALGRGLPIRYESTSAESLVDSGARYDVVLNMEVVEHVADLDTFMRACTHLVRPGGAMVVATINRTVRAFLFAILGAEYVLRWLPRGTHQWRRFPRPGELETLLAAGSMQVDGRTGVRVNPFTRRFSLTDDLGVNYMLTARKPA